MSTFCKAFAAIHRDNYRGRTDLKSSKRRRTVANLYARLFVVIPMLQLLDKYIALYHNLGDIIVALWKSSQQKPNAQRNSKKRNLKLLEEEQ